MSVESFYTAAAVNHKQSFSWNARWIHRSLRSSSSSRSRKVSRLRLNQAHCHVCSCTRSDFCSEPLRSEQPYGIPDTQVPSQWDVLGLGQAMVDFCGIVGDDVIDRLELHKGVRKVVDHEQRGKVLRALDGRSYKVSAGGSLSNTLVALARLGMGRINVAMTGSVGKDALGDFFRTKLLRANVHFLSKPIDNGTTGTVIVLTTPDAQRTMLSYQGMSSVIDFDRVLAEALSNSRLLVVEGYLWEIPQTIEALSRACQAAREANVLVALTASDVSCISRHREQFWEVMQSSADVLFANSDEAKALCGFGSSTSTSFTAEHLSKFCRLVSVTDGVRGSYIALQGSVVYIPPSPCEAVDTCGAGDLYGLLCGAPDLELGCQSCCYRRQSARNEVETGRRDSTHDGICTSSAQNFRFRTAEVLSREIYSAKFKSPKP